MLTGPDDDGSTNLSCWSFQHGITTTSLPSTLSTLLRCWYCVRAAASCSARLAMTGAGAGAAVWYRFTGASTTAGWACSSLWDTELQDGLQALVGSQCGHIHGFCTCPAGPASNSSANWTPACVAQASHQGCFSLDWISLLQASLVHTR